MYSLSTVLALGAALAMAEGQTESRSPPPRVPSINVPAWPSVATIQYSRSVPNLTQFPSTRVELSYTADHLSLTFIADGETNFYFNSSQGTNEDIWEYEVMEAFIYKGTDDPATYLEYEVNPNNITYQAMVYNPSKNRAAGAPFDHFFVADPSTDGFSATTTVNKTKHTWVSKALIPLALFNVDSGAAKGTSWRMNFFRTITDPSIYPDQILGAWSPPDIASFHISKYFGHVKFV